MAKKLTLLDLLPVTAPGILTDAMKQDMQKYLSADTQVIHTQIPNGPITIECEYDEAFSAPEVVKLAVSTAAERPIDGIFVNCFGDPGV